MDETRWVQDASAIPPGGSARFHLAWGGRRVEAFVVNVGGRFHAYVNRCVHQGTPLDLWPNDFFTEDGRLLICATHGALYTPETGACAGGPCHGGALTALPVRVEAGRVIVTVPADGQG